ncbi:UDP-glucose 4-epimerase [Hondaea fermentalgiana]|uniref:UDP-glucose 4-epimerase n=1 Tax=Hondaea fermentalgiana TaxID=2315210 RepID=A0A2R5FZM5_9STRA|nr:UDP-glucose 4-epimerase [Hondaea fermentalgiana]|eukprot:GBG24217.1 UDP-glucose 4-epimerase [Hondaea fermentalgiana]
MNEEANCGEGEGSFEPRSILITGGAGFIGSHVLNRVLEAFPDTKVVVMDNLSYCASTKNLDSALKHPNCSFVHGNITSSDLVVYVLEKEEVDCVLHFAAETHVDNSFGNSFRFTETNVMGTHVLLEACKRMNGQILRFIHVSTDEVYGESLGAESFMEESVLEPTNPYAASKAAAEFMAKAYHRSFKVPVIITRGNNVYGPRQYPEKIIPKFIHQMMRNSPLTVHGDGSTRRNMLYVSDVADAFVTILRHAVPGQTINIGGNEELSVLEIASAILDAFGRNKTPGQETWLNFVEDRKFNDTRYNIDKRKLHELGWRQKVDFTTGLSTTLEWYKANQNHWGSIEHALVAHPRVFGEDNSHEPPRPPLTSGR